MPSKPITRKQLNILIEETRKEKNTEVAERDILMYEILYYHGLRPGECRLIEISHINFKEKTLFIPRTNNKERQEDLVYFIEFIFEKIINYLKKRNFSSKWLFPSILNKIRNLDNPIDMRTSQINFTKRLKRRNSIRVLYHDCAGMPRYDLNLYSFRKRFGTFAYLKFGFDVERTDRVLRHRDRSHRSVWAYVQFVGQITAKSLIFSLYEDDSHNEKLIKEVTQIYS